MKEKEYAYAARLCAKKECAEAEIRQKLRRRGVEEEEVDEIISVLVDDHYLDASRYLRAFVHDHVAYDLWGRQRLRHALQMKGFAAKGIDEVLEEEIDAATYEKNLRTVLQRKARTLSPPDENATFAERRRYFQRLAAYAAQRGYEPHLIFETLEGELDEI